jgi:hypothetical protein
MSYNESWNKWIVASIVKHFKAVLDAASIDNFIEGMSNRDLTKSEYVEIRVDGPYADERSKNDFILRVEVNLLVQTIVNPAKNLYRHAELQGICMGAFITIPVYKLGNEVEDDKTQFGCLQLNTDEPRDHVMAHNFGQVETDVKLQQASVEGHYKIELEG